MAQEKLFTAKQAADAVLKKTQEILAKSELFKAEKSRHDRCVEHVEANSPGVKNAHAVCVAEGVKPSNWKKDEKENLKKDGATLGSIIGFPGAPPTAPITKAENENSKKENAKPSEHSSKEAFDGAKGKGPKGEIHPKEQVEGEAVQAGKRIKEQKSPEKNSKEQAEGNNELAGTTPTQVGEDGKNKPGFDEMKGHLKLAKFIGHMESKRKMKEGISNG